MADTTGISWCATVLPDGRIIPGGTFNFWIGCTQVSAGCQRCYAKSENDRFGWNPAGWGKGKPRKLTSEANRKKPLAWAKQAKAGGYVKRVFPSLMDPLDAEVPWEWRQALWDLIDLTGGPLEWLLLTKRIENADEMLPASWLKNPPPYVRLGVTAEDQENADSRIPLLLQAWKGKNFISVEPMLGPVDLNRIEVPDSIDDRPLHFSAIQETHDDAFYSGDRLINWVICGGESGAGCRPMNLDWARDLRRQCKAANVPYFFKQIGGFPDKRHDPAEWPADLRVREFPE